MRFTRERAETECRECGHRWPRPAPAFCGDCGAALRESPGAVAGRRARGEQATPRRAHLGRLGRAAALVLGLLVVAWLAREVLGGAGTEVALDPSEAFDEADESASRDDVPVGCGAVHGCYEGCAAPFALDRPVLWCRGHGGAPAPPAVSGSTVVTVRQDAIVAVDRTTGAERWRTPAPLVPLPLPVATDPLTGRQGGALVLVADPVQDVLVAYDLDDGGEVWRGPEHTGGTATVVGDTVVVGGQQGHVTGLDVLTGERRWQRGGSQPAFRPPAVAGGLVYLAGPGTVVGVDLATGILRVELGLGRRGAGRTVGPYVRDATGVAVSGTGLVVVFDTASGARRWSHQLDQPLTAEPVLGDGRLHLLTADDALTSFSLVDGAWLATATIGDALGGQRTLSVERDALVLTTLTEVRLLDLDTLAPRDVLDLGRAIVGAPIATGGTVFVTTQAGLYAIGPP